MRFNEQEQRLRSAWQDLVDQDYSACDDVESAEFLERNARVNQEAEGLSWWRQYRVFRSLDTGRRGPAGGRRLAR